MELLQERIIETTRDVWMDVKEVLSKLKPLSPSTRADSFCHLFTQL